MRAKRLLILPSFSSLFPYLVAIQTKLHQKTDLEHLNSLVLFLGWAVGHLCLTQGTAIFVLL
jgi:hypothetical protein